MENKEMTNEEIYAWIKERGEDELFAFAGVIVASAINHDLDIERVRDISFIVIQDFLKEHQSDIEFTKKFHKEIEVQMDEIFKKILGGM